MGCVVDCDRVRVDIVCADRDSSLESLMEDFSFAITTDVSSSETISFGKKEFQYFLMKHLG